MAADRTDGKLTIADIRFNAVESQSKLKWASFWWTPAHFSGPHFGFQMDSDKFKQAEDAKE